VKWNLPFPLLPKVIRRLERRGVDVSQMRRFESQASPMSSRLEYGSVYQTALEEFPDSSDSD
jgi:hypothetical protein